MLQACNTAKNPLDQEGDLVSKKETEQKELLSVKSVDDARLKARKAIQENKIDLAQAYYVKAYGMEPENISLLQEMTQLYKMMQKNDLVEFCYQLILKQQPKHYQTIKKYGLLLIKLNKYQQAEDKLIQALSMPEAENDWGLLNGLGLVKDLQDKHLSAIFYFKLALKIVPKQVAVLNNIAYSLYRVKKYNEAINYYKQALAINPKARDVLFNFALLKARTKDYDTAVSIFSKLMDPAKANNDVGYIAMKNGDLVQAEYFLQNARRLSSRFYKKAFDNQQALKELLQR